MIFFFNERTLRSKVPERLSDLVKDVKDLPTTSFKPLRNKYELDFKKSGVDCLQCPSLDDAFFRLLASAKNSLVFFRRRLRLMLIQERKLFYLCS